MTAISTSWPFALRLPEPASAAFGSRSAMMTFAPASASASAHASPIPCPPPVTTVMRPVRIRHKPHAVPGLQVEFANAACRECSEFPGIDIEEGVAAEVLGDRYGPGPPFSFLAALQMFGRDAD